KYSIFVDNVSWKKLKEQSVKTPIRQIGF
ncbi:MAG: hypothetical protein K0R36_2824, partial [Chryseobacterium sp.]|nr:hypothetical protein [Chryseobacterium sp.]